MIVRHYSKPSPLKREGEDALILNPRLGIYGVLDGVTPLNDFADKDGHNGAYIAANLFKVHFERPDATGGLEQLIVEANRLLRQRMLEHGVDTGVKHELWATCIAAAQVGAEEIRYAQLGDCMAVARYIDGTVAVLTRNLVNGVSERAKAKRERDRRNGIDVPDESHFDLLPNRLAYNRWMANIPEGYGVANGMEEAAAFIQSGTVPLQKLTHFLLVTDGMFHPDEPLETTLRRMLEEGVERYVERVEEAERARGLRPDDRTAVLIER